MKIVRLYSIISGNFLFLSFRVLVTPAVFEKKNPKQNNNTQLNPLQRKKNLKNI